MRQLSLDEKTKDRILNALLVGSLLLLVGGFARPDSAAEQPPQPTSSTERQFVLKKLPYSNLRSYQEVAPLSADALASAQRAQSSDNSINKVTPASTSKSSEQAPQAVPTLSGTPVLQQLVNPVLQTARQLGDLNIL